MSNFAASVFSISLLLTTPFLQRLTVTVSGSLHYIVLTPSLADPACYGHCLTLSQFAGNIDRYIDSNKTLLILRGIHILNESISVFNVTEFSMTAADTSSGSVSIKCNKGANINITHVARVHISGLIFTSCGGNQVKSIDQLTIENTSFIGNNANQTALAIVESNVSIIETTFLSHAIGSYRKVADLFASLENFVALSSLETITASVGGAMIITHSNLAICNCHFEGNQANIGGAIFSESESNISISESVFIANSVTSLKKKLGHGGALFSDGSGIISVHNSTFKDNTADQYGGALVVFSTQSLSVSTSYDYLNISVTKQSYSLVLKDTTVYHNRAKSGGALYLHGINITINCCDVSHNRAEKMGGAIASNFNSILVNNSTFAKNLAGTEGGMMSIQQSSVVIRNSAFMNNSAHENGGVVLAKSYSGPFYSVSGSAPDKTSSVIIKHNNTALNIFDSTFHNNTAVFGGVIYAVKSIGIIVAKSTFCDNFAKTDGGVVFLDKTSTVTINSCAFHRNEVDSQGGVIEARSRSSVTIGESMFTYNKAQIYGGVIHVIDGSSVNVSISIFEHNHASIDGGVFNSYRSCSVKVHGSTFIGNTAKINGGVSSSKLGSEFNSGDNVFKNSNAHVLGAVINAEDSTLVSIQNCYFTQNSADYGGGIYAIRNSKISINCSIFSNNTAHTDGGTLIARTNSKINVENSTFFNNTAVNDGNIMSSDSSNIFIIASAFRNNVAGNDGGVVYAYDNSTIIIQGSYFARNRAGGSGGALYMRKKSIINISNSSVHNCIAQNSGGGMHLQEEIGLTIDTCMFSNNVADHGGVLHMSVQSNAYVINSKAVGNKAIIEGGFVGVYKASSVYVKATQISFSKAVFGGTFIAYQSSKLLFEDSTFHHNIADHGGVIRALQRSMLNVTNSTFSYNAAEMGGVLSFQSGLVDVQFSSFDHNIARYNGGAVTATNGSTVKMYDVSFNDNRAHSDGGVISLYDNSNVVIVNCSKITNNTAYGEGGVLYLHQSCVMIASSNFTSCFAARCGGVISAVNSSVKVDRSLLNQNFAIEKGGVVALLGGSSNIQHSQFIDNFANHSSGGVLCLERGSGSIVHNSTFKKNKAKHSGGVISVQFKSTINITGCNFSHNMAETGGALAAMQDSSIYFDIFWHNHQVTTDGLSSISFNNAKNGGGIYQSRSNIFFGGKVIINHNHATEYGGGLHVVKSTIMIKSSVLFNSNSAGSGGGIALSASKLYDIRGTNAPGIKFISNQAFYGGALYVADEEDKSVCSSSPYSEKYSNVSGCFFQEATNDLQIFFKSNYANISGSDLYGGLLDRCRVSSNINSSVLKPIGTAYFKEISNLTNFDTVSSKPVRLCLCKNDVPNCSQRMQSIQIKRGDDFKLSVVAVDHVNHAVKATIQSHFKKLTVPESQNVRNIGANCSYLDYEVALPNADEYELTAYAHGPCKNESISKFTFTVHVQNCVCAHGFIQAKYTTKCSCICDNRFEIFSKYIDDCNPETETVTRRGTFWIMYLLMNASEDSNPYLIYPYCPMDYCHPPSELVSVNLNLPNGSDAQCANNRGGILCGRCRPNYSLSLGSSKCIRCPKNWYGHLLGITTVAFFAGIILVALLLVLNLTVSVGTINSVIFYVNIINANESIYIGRSGLTFIPIFISWLNLDSGFDTCFFEGMDMYAKTWLQLAFPAYIMLLVIVIICISSISIKFSAFIGKKNPVATLATLILLSYTKLLKTIIVTFSFIELKYPNGSIEIKWLPDASVGYTEWKHIALICVAIATLALGLVYTALIFFWQWLLNCPRSKAFSWTRNQKLHHFIDTYHTVHTAKHRYWTGLLLQVRVIVNLISAFSISVDPRITLLSTVLIMCCLFLYKTTFTIRVYKNWLLNAMESFIYFNITIFSAFTWFTLIDDPASQKKEIFHKVAAYICIGSVSVLFLMTVVFHVYRYGNAKVYSLIRNSRLGKVLKDNISHDEASDHLPSVDRDVYNLLNAIDNPGQHHGYTPPPMCLQQAPTSSVISIAKNDQPSAL